MEIDCIKKLQALALKVRQSQVNNKWEALSHLLQEEDLFFDVHGQRRKLVIFTEHRDTLTYLTDKIEALLGGSDAMVIIHGGVKREDRRRIQRAFTQDPSVHILVATNAAGEGINLHRAHLMMDAIRYGDKPEVKERLREKVEEALDKNRMAQLMDQNTMAHDIIDVRQSRIR